MRVLEVVAIYSALVWSLIPKPRNARAFIGGQGLIARFHTSWVGLPGLRVLLLHAKDLFVAASLR